MEVGNTVGEKYILIEKLFEGDLVQYWKAETKPSDESEEKQFFLVVHPKKDLSKFAKITSQASLVWSSVEEKLLVFPYLEGRPLSEILKGPLPMEVVGGLKIIQKILDTLYQLKGENPLPPNFLPELIWVDKKNIPHFLPLELFHQVNTQELAVKDSEDSEEKSPQKEQQDSEQNLIFSVGILAHQILTGSAPSDEKSISEFNAEVPMEFDGVFKKAVIKDSQKRYAYLEEFATSFDSSLELSGLSLEEENLGKILLFFLVLLVGLLAFFSLSQKNQNKKKKFEVKAIQRRIKEIIKERNAYIIQKYKEHKDMVFIPKGKFILGRKGKIGPWGSHLTKDSKKGIANEVPPREVDLDGYWIDKYEVNYKAYLLFADFTAITHDHKFCHPDEGPDKNHYPLSAMSSMISKTRFAVAGADWFDAYGFAHFMGMKLPTEAQWEKAAKGTEGLWKKRWKKKGLPGVPVYPPTYPWGEADPKGKAHYRGATKKFHPVDPRAFITAYPEGQSIYGVFNLSGNVWEFVRDRYQADFFQTLSTGAKNPFNSWKNAEKNEIIRVVLKGGGYNNSPLMIRCATRVGELPTFRRNTGFRCILLPSNKATSPKKKNSEKKNEKKSGSK